MMIKPLAVAVVCLAVTTGYGAPLLHTFSSPNSIPYGRFGNALAVDDQRIYIVAEANHLGATLSGTGYAFDRKTFEHVATYPGVQANATVRHIQSNGSDVYMGSWPGDVDGVDRAGFGAIYDAATGALKYVIENPTPETDERFGSWAAPLGTDEWLIGAYKSNDQTPLGGAAFIYSGGDLETTLLDPSLPTAGHADRFGYSVGSTEDYALVGSYRDSEIVYGAGAVHVYDHAGTYLYSIDNPQPESADLFGSSLATKAHHAIIGAFDDDGPDVDDVGAVFLYDLDSRELLLRIDNPEPQLEDKFGFKVAWVGDNIAVGTWDESEGIGENRVFVFDGVTGELLEALADPTGGIGNSFGFELVGVGTDLLVGADATYSGGQTKAGVAYLFDGSAWLPAPGDADHDGAITSSDYLRWAGEFDGTYLRGPADGDFNYDGIANGLDYLIWADAFAHPQTSVPEPTTAFMVLVGSMLLFIGRLQSRAVDRAASV
ncbi:MAG: hypothetical protein R3C10_00030 [Pirellulales bacterium]